MTESNERLYQYLALPLLWAFGTTLFVGLFYVTLAGPMWLTIVTLGPAGAIGSGILGTIFINSIFEDGAGTER
jgi:hypothetical protein